jgi:hypothetical protein
LLLDVMVLAIVLFDKCDGREITRQVAAEMPGSAELELRVGERFGGVA